MHSGLQLRGPFVIGKDLVNLRLWQRMGQRLIIAGNCLATNPTSRVDDQRALQVDRECQIGLTENAQNVNFVCVSKLKLG